MNNNLSTEELVDEVFRSYESDFNQFEKHLKEYENALKNEDYDSLRVSSAFCAYYWLKLDETLQFNLGDFFLGMFPEDEELKQSFLRKVEWYEKRNIAGLDRLNKVDLKIIEKYKKIKKDFGEKKVTEAIESGLIPSLFIVRHLREKDEETWDKINESLSNKEMEEFYGEKTFKRIEKNSDLGYI